MLKFDFSKTVTAFPTTRRETTIDELRERVMENKGTGVFYSDVLDAVVCRIKYGNEYIKRGADGKKANEFMLTESGVINEQEFESQKDDILELLREMIVDNGEFDSEILSISEKMGDARKCSV